MSYLVDVLTETPDAVIQEIENRKTERIDILKQKNNLRRFPTEILAKGIEMVGQSNTDNTAEKFLEWIKSANF